MWSLVLHDLVERELNWGFATEDLDQASDLLSFDVDLGDRCMQRGKWSIDHSD